MDLLKGFVDYPILRPELLNAIPVIVMRSPVFPSILYSEVETFKRRKSCALHMSGMLRCFNKDVYVHSRHADCTGIKNWPVQLSC